MAPRVGKIRVALLRRASEAIPSFRATAPPPEDHRREARDRERQTYDHRLTTIASTPGELVHCHQLHRTLAGSSLHEAAAPGQVDRSRALAFYAPFLRIHRAAP
jgi:hypothetical protein